MTTVLETDVLIIGYGAAGANAAIAAHDAGARVLIVEKMPAGGGNSAVCAGAMVIPESLEAAISYYRALSSGTADEPMIRTFAEAMMDILTCCPGSASPTRPSRRYRRAFLRCCRDGCGKSISSRPGSRVFACSTAWSGRAISRF